MLQVITTFTSGFSIHTRIRIISLQSFFKKFVIVLVAVACLVSYRLVRSFLCSFICCEGSRRRRRHCWLLLLQYELRVRRTCVVVVFFHVVCCCVVVVIVVAALWSSLLLLRCLRLYLECCWLLVAGCAQYTYASCVSYSTVSARNSNNTTDDIRIHNHNNKILINNLLLSRTLTQPSIQQSQVHHSINHTTTSSLALARSFNHPAIHQSKAKPKQSKAKHPIAHHQPPPPLLPL